MTEHSTPIRIELPWPHMHLNPNSRNHWAAKAKAKKKARHDAAACALEAGIRQIDAEGMSVRITFHPPDRRPRDLDNALASLKAALDGISDVVGIDDSKWQIAIRRGDPVKGGSVLVEIEPVDTWEQIGGASDRVLSHLSIPKRGAA